MLECMPDGKLHICLEAEAPETPASHHEESVGRMEPTPTKSSSAQNTDGHEEPSQDAVSWDPHLMPEG